MASSYVIDQYNKVKNKDDELFMTFLENAGVADRKQVPVDEYDVIGTQDEDELLWDECFKLNGNFSTATTYYFHCQIERMPESTQVFNIKLIDSTARKEDEVVEQYIKTITIAGGNYSDWVDIEFTFTPLNNGFDSILFEMRRGVSDYRLRRRFAHIAYLELSIVNNFLDQINSNGIKLIKLGVQSHPSLVMCINRDEIRTCRTGIYELKNGIITVNFFSVVNGIKFTAVGEQQFKAWEDQIANDIIAIEASSMTDKEKEIAIGNIHSEYINYAREPRSIDNFTLDYMYRKET